MTLNFIGTKGDPSSTRYVQFNGCQYDTEWLPQDVRDKLEQCVNTYEQVVEALKKNMGCNIVNNMVCLERQGYTTAQARAAVEDMTPIKLARAAIAAAQK